MRESAFRHFMAWFAGEIDEDHAAASFFNILAAETTAYKIEEAKRVGSIAGLGAPTHRRHLDGSITDLATAAETSEATVMVMVEVLPVRRRWRGRRRQSRGR